MTVGEIQAGIELTREQDPRKARDIEAWLDDISATLQVLPMEAAAFRHWARLMHRRSDTLLEDAMIAAIAHMNGLVVVTRNTADFQGFGVPLMDPFH